MVALDRSRFACSLSFSIVARKITKITAFPKYCEITLLPHHPSISMYLHPKRISFLPFKTKEKEKTNLLSNSEPFQQSFRI